MTCPHGFAHPSHCGDCIADGWHPPVLPSRRAGVVRRFTAKYPGRCDRCGQPIDEGDEIALMDDDGYVHATHT